MKKKKQKHNPEILNLWLSHTFFFHSACDVNKMYKMKSVEVARSIAGYCMCGRCAARQPPLHRRMCRVNKSNRMWANNKFSIFALAQQSSNDRTVLTRKFAAEYLSHIRIVVSFLHKT